jgi:hypothetical protein
MNLSIALLTALAVPAATQPGQDPPQRRAPPPHDYVIGVAGNEVVLRTDLDMTLSSDPELAERNQRATTALEREQVIYDALRARMETLVMVQAGEDLGFSPELVEELTNSEFEDRIERFGGHRKASELLAEFGETPEQHKARVRDRLLAESWRRSRIGTAAGPTGRPSVDRYIRPGLLLSTYNSFVNSSLPEERAVVGKYDERVQLQLLQVNVPPEATRADAKDQVEVYLELYRSDAWTFDRLVTTYGTASSHARKGLLRPARVTVFDALGQQRHQGPELGDLCVKGEVGAVSEPLWWQRKQGDRTARAWCVYRIAKRLPATEAKPFFDRQLQGDLTHKLQSSIDDLREDIAFRAVLRETNTWFFRPERDGSLKREDMDLFILEGRAKKRGR